MTKVRLVPKLTRSILLQSSSTKGFGLSLKYTLESFKPPDSPDLSRACS